MANKPEIDPMMVVVVPLAALHLDPQNARKGNVQAISDSLKEFGQHRAIIAQKTTGRIISGNHTFLAAQSLGWTHVNVFWVDDDDETALRRGLADNAVGDQAKWNEDALRELLEQTGTDIPGLDKAQVDKLFKDIEDIVPKEAIYPLLAKPGEYYDYVMFFTESELDSLFIRSLFEGKWICWKAEKRPASWSHLLPVSVLRQVFEKHGIVPEVTQNDKA
jgi:8-oxo-dGTP pyrophosphatase MutT (NUDIX family)